MIEETAAATPRVLGRPHEERADRAILSATLELMAESGVRDLRVDDVAGRAGVGKATIYRRYRSKDELITVAVAGLVSEITLPDTGRTRADLLALMRGAVKLYRGSGVEAAVMPSLVEAMSRDVQLARLVRERFLAGRRAALRAVLERGIQRGDLRADLDIDLALDVLGGPLFYRLLITGGPIDEQLAEGVVELILRGFAPKTKLVQTKEGSTMKIHAIQTGTVAITTKWREGAGRGRLRLVNTLLDREWTEPLPIYAFAIEHPEGVIVVDTGETARTSQPGYFPRWQPFFRFAVREQVRPEQEIGPQLEELGILPSDVRRVVMTHLHTDHAGGLHHFTDNEILVSSAELDYAAGLRGRLPGYPNKRLARLVRPTIVDQPVPTRAVSGEHGANQGRRRDPGAGPRTHPRPTCCCRGGRRPRGVSRRG